MGKLRVKKNGGYQLAWTDLPGVETVVKKNRYWLERKTFEWGV